MFSSHLPTTLTEFYGTFMHALIAFFAIMNPIGNLPIFLSVTDGHTSVQRYRIATTSVLTAFFIVLVFAFTGQLIFRMFSINIDSFRVAGGMIVFFIAWHLLHGRHSSQHHPEYLHDPEKEPEDDTDIAITPLATPILAGPGTITTALTLIGREHSVERVAAVLAAFLLICLITWIMFVLAERVVAFVGEKLIRVVTRLMGLILAVIGVQMVIEGLKALLF